MTMILIQILSTDLPMQHDRKYAISMLWVRLERGIPFERNSNPKRSFVFL